MHCCVRTPTRLTLIFILSVLNLSHLVSFTYQFHMLHIIQNVPMSHVFTSKFLLLCSVLTLFTLGCYSERWLHLISLKRIRIKYLSHKLKLFCLLFANTFSGHFSYLFVPLLFVSLSCFLSFCSVWSSFMHKWPHSEDTFLNNSIHVLPKFVENVCLKT